MILLIGHGYIGSEFQRQIDARLWPMLNASYQDVDGFWKTHQLLKNLKPSLVINAAAFIPVQSVKLCDEHPSETIRGNVLLPTVLAAACADQGIPFAHISTGCLWSDGKEHGEDDPPQRAFTGHCGFYIGTKVLAEEEVRKSEKHYIWRVRIPFDEFDSQRNYLSKLAHFKEVWVQENSACHRRDCVRACLDLWEKQAPFGTYHLTNPGVVNVTDVVTRMQRMGLIEKVPVLIDKKDGECQLSSRKLEAAGVVIRNVEEAITESLEHWTPEKA